ncbi:glutamine amidotransferase-like class 1 domain-containing protein 3, mitochondrial [Bolinopsis microptera]|uniref:glutamine amidotransferase-like class 1 domain-containing protein 3, mitochondrial n=2 Tax=Bolinopsis microptera TaxID=2820187 RepID=UPI003079750C
MIVTRLNSCARTMSTKVAVLLSGCGVYDGTEVHESSAVLTHLSRQGALASCFAPDKDQMHVVDHTAGTEMSETRNVLKESARIARGKISALTELNVGDFDALIVPGGFGAAKNLSSFATQGVDMTVDLTVSDKIAAFHSAGKPIGLCCIAPVLAAKLIPGVELTVGSDQEGTDKWPYAGTAAAIDAMGGKHVVTDVSEAHVDSKNKVVTTAAFMCETDLHEIHDGVGAMVTEVLKLVT